MKFNQNKYRMKFSHFTPSPPLQIYITSWFKAQTTIQIQRLVGKRRAGGSASETFLRCLSSFETSSQAFFLFWSFKAACHTYFFFFPLLILLLEYPPIQGRETHWEWFSGNLSNFEVKNNCTTNHFRKKKNSKNVVSFKCLNKIWYKFLWGL